MERTVVFKWNWETKIWLIELIEMSRFRWRGQIDNDGRTLALITADYGRKASLWRHYCIVHVVIFRTSFLNFFFSLYQKKTKKLEGMFQPDEDEDIIPVASKTTQPGKNDAEKVTAVGTMLTSALIMLLSILLH